MKIISALILSLTAITTPALAAGDVAKGEKVYKKCRACHMVGEGAKNKVGPPLNEIIGRQVGVAADYKYSKAMIAASDDGLIWDVDNLTKFLTKPKAHIKGTKMSFVGLKKPADKENLLAYLAQFSTATEETVND